MSADFDRPLMLRLAEAVVGVASALIPQTSRRDWVVHRLAELQYRYRFLRQIQGWGLRTQLGISGLAIQYAGEACWISATREEISQPVARIAKSPWTCLSALTVIFLLIGLFSRGYPATRQLITSYSRDSRVLFLWMHPFTGSGDRGIPQEVITAWGSHAKTVAGAAGFTTSRDVLRAAGTRVSGVLVVRTEPSLFKVLEIRPQTGQVPSPGKPGALISNRAWIRIFHGDPNILGRVIGVGGQTYSIYGVLPSSLSLPVREAGIYVVDPPLWRVPVMAVVRAKAGASWTAINRDLRKTAEDDCYFFFGPQLRHVWRDTEVQTPMRFFAIIVCIGGILFWRLWPVRIRDLRAAVKPQNRIASSRRYGFFAVKTTIGLFCVLVGCLEARRSAGAVIFASQDPANGPFLVWLLVLGIFAVLAWSAMDQQARCRECLDLLGFPVRIGSPGSLLLSWSGTELLCAKGHGVLHVPHMATSWDEEPERWVALDESWRGLFNR